MTKRPTSIFSVLNSNIVEEEEGRWFYDIFGTKDPEDPVANPGIDIKLRRIQSKASQRVRQRVEKDFRVGIRAGEPVPEPIIDKMLIEQLAAGVIVDWAGMFDDDGNEIPFSRDAARDLLTKLPNFRLVVLGMSSELNNYKDAVKAAVSGN